MTRQKYSFWRVTSAESLIAEQNKTVLVRYKPSSHSWWCGQDVLPRHFYGVTYLPCSTTAQEMSANRAAGEQNEQVTKDVTGSVRTTWLKLFFSFMGHEDQVESTTLSWIRSYYYYPIMKHGDKENTEHSCKIANSHLKRMMMLTATSLACGRIEKLIHTCSEFIGTRL